MVVLEDGNRGGLVAAGQAPEGAGLLQPNSLLRAAQLAETWQRQGADRLSSFGVPVGGASFSAAQLPWCNSITSKNNNIRLCGERAGQVTSECSDKTLGQIGTAKRKPWAADAAAGKESECCRTDLR